MRSAVKLATLVLLVQAGLVVSVSANEGQSANDVLKTSAVSASGASAASATQRLRWGTVGETAGDAAASTSFQVFGSFPAQLRQGGSPPALRIDGVTPDTGPLGGGTSVTVSGAGFVAGSQALFEGQPLLEQVRQDSSTITGLTPSGAALGPVDVTVTTPQQSVVFHRGFVYHDGLAPRVLSVTPNRGGPMLVVSIRGEHFTTTSTTTVKFSLRYPAVAVHVIDATELLAIVPPTSPPPQPVQPATSPPALQPPSEPGGAPRALLRPVVIGNFFSPVDVIVMTMNGQGVLPRGFAYRRPVPADPCQGACDSIPPVITSLTPADGSAVNQPLAQIRGTFQDVGLGVDFRTVRLVLDGEDITREARLKGTDVTFIPFTPLAAGLHTVTLDLADTLGNTAHAASTFFIGPLIINLTPQAGVFLNQPRPAIAASFVPIEGGAAINPAAVVLTVDGVNVTAQASVTAEGLTYTPPGDLADGSHTVTVQVSDLDGHLSQPANATFTIDTIPPILYFTTPVDGQFVNTTPLDASGYVNDAWLSTINVNGAPATRTETTFGASMALVGGSNALTAVATDLAGNQRQQTIAVTLDTAAPTVAITSPADQAVIDQTSVTVAGTIDDPTAAVFVNFMPASVPVPGTWRALHIPLPIGQNPLVATAIDPAGNQATASITVQTTTQTDAVTLTVSPQSGTPPLAVTFTPTATRPDVINFQYDWEGDGTVDFTTATADPVPHVYGAVEVYQPSVTAQTVSGELFSASTMVNVHEPPVVEGSIAVTDPVDVEVDRGGLIYVLSRAQAHILIYRFDEPPAGFQLQQTVTGGWSAPEGFDLTEDLALFIADTGNHRIQKLIPSGDTYTLDPTFGTNGSLGSLGPGQGQFNRPVDVAVDDTGAAFVSDEQNHRLQKFDSHGAFLMAVGTFGSDFGQFSSPQGLGYDFGALQVLVADAGNHRLQAFGRSGLFEQAIGVQGSGQGQCVNPAGASIDSVFGQRVMVDTGNNRVQLFDREGAFLQELTGLGLLAPRAAAAVPLPADDMVRERTFYIADTGNNRLLRIVLPQGAIGEDPLAPYWALIAALHANDVDTAVATYADEVQADRRIVFNSLQVNHPTGIIGLGQDMAQDPAPVLVQRTGEEAIFAIIHHENDGEAVQYQLFLVRQHGQWKILQL